MYTGCTVYSVYSVQYYLVSESVPDPGEVVPVLRGQGGHWLEQEKRLHYDSL